MMIDRKELEQSMQREPSATWPGVDIEISCASLWSGAVFDPQTWTFRVFGEVEEEKSGNGKSSNGCRT